MAVRQGVLITAAALTIVVLALPSKASTLRGVDPALDASYQLAGGKFQCLDGSKTIPASQVNDGYCDCVDGTDEPGTVCIRG